MPRQRLERRRPERDDDFRRDPRQFFVEPVAAGFAFTLRGREMRAFLAVRFPFEVLHRVCQIERRAGKRGLGEDFVEQRARRTDERLAFAIFLIARLFADQHHARIGGTDARHGLRRVAPERAALARVERRRLRQQRALDRLQIRVDGHFHLGRHVARMAVAPRIRIGAGDQRGIGARVRRAFPIAHRHMRRHFGGVRLRRRERAFVVREPERLDGVAAHRLAAHGGVAEVHRLFLRLARAVHAQQRAVPESGAVRRGDHPRGAAHAGGEVHRGVLKQVVHRFEPADELGRPE